MKSVVRRFVSQAAIVVSMGVVCLIGNLRVHASEVKASTGSDVAIDRVAVAPRISSSRQSDIRAPDEERIASSADAGHFVPAIYAWDPDVRFVFYRHVSKWM